MNFIYCFYSMSAMLAARLAIKVVGTYCRKLPNTLRRRMKAVQHKVPGCLLKEHDDVGFMIFSGLLGDGKRLRITVVTLFASANRSTLGDL
jgi:hypothetical protein